MKKYGLEFDDKGYLKPYERITINIEEFEEFFIKNFEPDSTRREIYESYKNFLFDFRKEINPSFIQWINGSFVTNKTNPNDIDFVTLIDHNIYQKKRNVIDNRFRLKNAKEIYNVDAYTVEIYPEDHPKHSISKIDLVYWNNWFSKTKKNRAKKNFPKGYVEINFEN